MLVRGTRLLIGEEASQKRELIAALGKIAGEWGAKEVELPSLELAQIYTDKAGPEVLGQMYTFPDRKGRGLCLRPEGTATCQLLAREEFKFQKNIKLWYETRCWRYERPQAGRYREFTQFGVEVLNPSKDYEPELVELASSMVSQASSSFVVNRTAKRGLAYYVGDGFEITIESLGAQKQVVGGGRYDEGIGFAIGIDRLLLAKE